MLTRRPVLFCSILCFGLIIVGCATTNTATITMTPDDLNADAVQGVEHPALRQLLHRHWEASMAYSPTWASSLGDRRYHDKLSDGSHEAILERRAWNRALLSEARAIDTQGLSTSDRTTLQLFIESRAQSIASEVCEFHLWNISPRGNLFSGLSFLTVTHTVDTPESGRALIARYQAIPEAVEQTIANLRLGLQRDMVANAQSLKLTVAQIRDAIAKPIDEWALYKPALEPLESWTLAERENFRKTLRATLEGPVRKSFQDYLQVLEGEVLPRGRDEAHAGMQHLPKGAACYEAMVLSYTSLPLSADELHQTGLAELQKIHAEFSALGARTLDTTDRATIFKHLREAQTLRFKSADAIITKAEAALGAARDAIPKFFGRLPQAPCVVTPIPDHEAPYTTVAYYMGPSDADGRPGQYFVNTYQPETRPRHEAEVLAFHESIPGHHLQIAIARELPALPAFRKHTGTTAFVEGWALYSERLADEMGLYSGDVDRFGMLAFDAWRAARLVVDTGLHAKGWSREDAVQFMLENTPLAENNIRNEVDRYLTTPGQALAYKTGQLEIFALRKKAQRVLGKRFSLPAFHDVVLSGGAVSLPVLRDRVNAWIKSSQAR